MHNEIDTYIRTFPEATQALLQTLRATIREAAPEASEAIKYGIPTYVQQGNLVHFAAYKKHIGFYPAPSGLLAFEKELSSYKSSKGAVQFPLDQPLPLALIRKIVLFRIKENIQNAASKK